MRRHYANFELREMVDCIIREVKQLEQIQDKKLITIHINVIISHLTSFRNNMSETLTMYHEALCEKGVMKAIPINHISHHEISLRERILGHPRWKEYGNYSPAPMGSIDDLYPGVRI